MKPMHSFHRIALGALLLGTTVSAFAADITVRNAWMRPAREGAPAAGVYFDLVTDVPLKLVSASTPVAKSVAFVRVDQNSDGTSTDTDVKEFDLPGATETRFAYNGTRLDLREVIVNLPPGAPVPLTLQFVEGPERRPKVEIDVVVRGVILPPPPEQATKPN